MRLILLAIAVTVTAPVQSSSQEDEEVTVDDIMDFRGDMTFDTFICFADSLTKLQRDFPQGSKPGKIVDQFIDQLGEFIDAYNHCKGLSDPDEACEELTDSSDICEKLPNISPCIVDAMDQLASDYNQLNNDLKELHVKNSMEVIGELKDDVRKCAVETNSRQ